MAGPITWHNILGPRRSDSSAPFAAAQNAWQGGLDTLSKVIQQREGTQASNVLAQQEILKNDFMDQLYGAKDPDALAQLQLSREGMGNAARASVRGAEEERMNALFKQGLANDEYSDHVRDRAQAPAMDAAAAFAYQNDKAGFDAHMAENPGMSNVAPLYKSLMESGRDADTHQWASNADARAGEMQDSNLLTAGVNRDSTKQSILASRANVRSTEQATNQSGEKQDSWRQDELDKRYEQEIFRKVSTRAAEHNAMIADQKRAGIPVDGRLRDTDAKDAAVQDLVNNGVPGDVIMKLIPQINELYNSPEFSKEVGEDAVRTEGRKKAEEAELQYFKDNSISAEGSVEGARNAKELGVYAKSIANSADDNTALQGFIGKWSRKQYTLPDGRKVSIPQTIMENAIQGSRNDLQWGTRWARDSNQGDNAEIILRDMMREPRFIQDMAARYQVDASEISKLFHADDIRQAGKQPDIGKPKTDW